MFLLRIGSIKVIRQVNLVVTYWIYYHATIPFKVQSSSNVQLHSSSFVIIVPCTEEMESTTTYTLCIYNIQ